MSDALYIEDAAQDAFTRFDGPAYQRLQAGALRL